MSIYWVPPSARYWTQCVLSPDFQSPLLTQQFVAAVDLPSPPGLSTYRLARYFLIMSTQ